jgi:hypothetical protein
LALLASPIVRATTSDEELAARQSALQNEAAELLDELGQSKIFSDIGSLEVTGSYISHLMCWRELDVMLLVGPDFGPRDVLNLISRVMEFPGVVGFDGTNGLSAARLGSSRKSDITSRSCFSAAPAFGASTCRCGYMIFMKTSLCGIGSCVARSPMSSGRRCCGSRTCGSDYRATPIRSAASRSTLPSSMTTSEHQRSSAAGSSTANCSTYSRVTESGAQCQLQLAGLAKDVSQREHQPRLGAASEGCNLVR